MATFAFVLVILSITLVCGLDANNKYSKNANKRFPKDDKMKRKFDELYGEEKPFRMNRVNLVWEKAKKRLEQEQLTELFVDLRLQDKFELEAKKHRNEDDDKIGKYAGQASKKMAEIMRKYGLDTFDPDQNELPGGDENEILQERRGRQPLVDRNFKEDRMLEKLDKKMDKLWGKAETAGFTDEELAGLREEFEHHQQKMDMFRYLRNELDVMVTDDKNDNSLDQVKKGGDIKGKRVKTQQLKDHHKEMMKKYEILEEKTLGQIRERADFAEPKTQQLWTAAKEANFTDIELASFKEELKHFEHKLQKHDFLVNEVQDIRTNKKAREGKTNEAGDSSAQKFDHLENKARDYGHKVNKIHKELKTRLAKQMGLHSEL